MIKLSELRNLKPLVKCLVCPYNNISVSNMIETHNGAGYLVFHVIKGRKRILTVNTQEFKRS